MFFYRSLAHNIRIPNMQGFVHPFSNLQSLFYNLCLKVSEIFHSVMGVTKFILLTFRKKSQFHNLMSELFQLKSADFTSLWQYYLFLSIIKFGAVTVIEVRYPFWIRCRFLCSLAFASSIHNLSLLILK